MIPNGGSRAGKVRSVIDAGHKKALNASPYRPTSPVRNGPRVPFLHCPAEA